MTHGALWRMFVQGRAVPGCRSSTRGKGLLVPSLSIPEWREWHDERVFPFRFILGQGQRQLA